MTGNQLWLLAAVKAGEIRLYGDGKVYHHATGQQVTAALRPLHATGLVELGDPGPASTPYRLTAKGEREMAKAADKTMKAAR